MCGEPMVRAILRIGKKGVLILPKKLRENLKVAEGDELLAEVSEGVLILRPFKPKIVDVDPSLVEKILSEEGELERRRARRRTRRAVLA